MAPVRLAVLLVLASLALPLAGASAATGDLVASAVRVDGDVALHADGASLKWSGADAPALAAHATSVRIERFGVQQTRAGGLVNVAPQTVNERASHANAALAFDVGPQGGLALQTTRPVQATLAAVEARPVGFVLLAQAGPELECPQPNDADTCLDARGVTGLASSFVDLVLPDQLVILLHGPTLVVDEAGKAVRYASGKAEDGSDTWTRVTLVGASGTLRATGDVALFAARPTMDAVSATLAAADGRIDTGLSTYLARDQDVAVAGQLHFTMGDVAPAAGDRTGLVYGRSMPVHLAGDVTSVSVRAIPFYEARPTQTAALAAIVVATLAGFAYAWPHVSFFAATLYTRLRQPQILENEVRNSIYEIIRLNPGISARAVHRLSTQSWGTVVYHLRQLEKHHLVVSRSVGRTRNYYENHGKYRGMEVQLACLQSPRARALARLVLEHPGIAQEDLATGSGFPQPTTSYYVRKLKAAGLVEERREGRYARYHPVSDVARFLKLAEAQGSPVDPGPGPAQA